MCHSGPCGPCPEEGERHCPCGKAVYPNLKCDEQAPLCGGTCGKVLDCGVHTCQERCHYGHCNKVCAHALSTKCVCVSTVDVYLHAVGYSVTVCTGNSAGSWDCSLNWMAPCHQRLTGQRQDSPAASSPPCAGNQPGGVSQCPPCLPPSLPFSLPSRPHSQPSEVVPTLSP